MGDSHAHQFITGNPGYVGSLIYDFTCFRADKSSDGMQGRGLPRTVGTNQSHNFSLVNIKGDSFYGLDYTVVYFQIPDFKHSHIIRSSYSPRYALTTSGL